jgi:hypothetical protein
MRLWILVLVAGYALWFLQSHLAKRDGMHNPQQMMTSHGIQKGITFVRHGSTWWVFFALIPMLTFLTYRYGGQWSGRQWLIALIVGFIFSGAMHYTYTLAPYPDYMVKDRRLSQAGWAHFVLFTGAIAVLLLFYTATAGLSLDTVTAVSVYVVWHVFVGNHMSHKLYPSWDFPPYKFGDVQPWLAIAGTAVIVTGASFYTLSH